MNTETNVIGTAMARIPSGCSILTVQHEGKATGVLVSWVQQAAFDPPTITVCLKRGRGACKLLDGSGRFLLNVIGEDPTKLFKHFGRGFSLEEDAFKGLSTERTPYGPKLHDGIAHLACRLIEKVPVGDHDLCVAEVVAAEATEGRKPYVHLRKNGMAY